MYSDNYSLNLHIGYEYLFAEDELPSLGLITLILSF